jgi:hypothetical protein
VLFHLTISHGAQDCPGRRPSEPPALVGPSDTRKNLEQELGVTLHFVLWGAACMLWAQPEHLAFAVVEADDLASASQFADALMPTGWTCTALPVWNLPAQLRLVRQVRMAPPMQFGEALPSAHASAQSEPAAKEPPVSSSAPQVGKPPDPVDEPTTPGSVDTPGTITRLLREMDTGSTPPRQRRVTTRSDEEIPLPITTPTQILSPRSHEPTPTVRVWLVAVAGPAKGKTYVVDGPSATIGRVPSLPVCIPDDRLSREHARIDFRTGGYWLSDLGSTNGTALNGTLLKEPQQLQSGDSIELGASLLVVTIEPTPEG